MKLWVMRGFSGSGKSYKAKEIATQNDAVVVNRDLLRLQLLGEYWTGKHKDEERVTLAEDAQVKALLGAGVNVVVDATHLAPKYVRKWARLATQMGAEFEVVNVHATLDECIFRDATRERSVGAKVITDQVKRFPPEKWPEIKADPPFVVEPVEWVDGLPSAVICDLDGTLAHHRGRSPYDFSRVKEDLIDFTIRELVDHYYHKGVKILIVSGRDDTCFADTEDWLNKNGVPFHELYMRPTDAVDTYGGKLPDTVIKRDIFDKYIRGQFNVLFCIDDRRKVIEMWRAMGLKVLDVAGNEF